MNFKNNRCQTYEGGFGATPGNEAHGGYSFCGLASLKLLNKERMCDIDSLTVINFFYYQTSPVKIDQDIS